ncbi:PhzF family phenazine biosynthesis protein [Streptomyces sp. NPDC056149]|uniref:PhzF family phenazine biosynthesis protein n=1 Tax=Streptomyces sp. NPDC056149 TaxID=3345728 RepID=UPI0035D975B4
MNERSERCAEVGGGGEGGGSGSRGSCGGGGGEGVDLLRVFCGANGRGGNALAVMREGAALPGQAERAALAAELGYSETVFLDSAAAARGGGPEGRGEWGVVDVDIHTPSVRLPFAGHPLVGVAWLLREVGRPVRALRPSAGEVGVRYDGDLTWVRGRASWVPGRRTERYGSVAEVDALPAPPPGEGWLYAWAWEDEAAGTVRARGFPRRGDGIVEDEATGAAALLLAHQLGRPLNVRQGVGSWIHARPCGDGAVEIGGRVRAEGPVVF